MIASRAAERQRSSPSAKARCGLARCVSKTDGPAPAPVRTTRRAVARRPEVDRHDDRLRRPSRARRRTGRREARRELADSCPTWSAGCRRRSQTSRRYVARTERRIVVLGGDVAASRRRAPSGATAAPAENPPFGPPPPHGIGERAWSRFHHGTSRRIRRPPRLAGGSMISDHGTLHVARADLLAVVEERRAAQREAQDGSRAGDRVAGRRVGVRRAQAATPGATGRGSTGRSVGQRLRAEPLLVLPCSRRRTPSRVPRLPDQLEVERRDGAAR